MEQNKRKKVHKNILMIVTMIVFLFSWCSIAHAEEKSVLLKDMHMEDSNECEIWEKELKDSYGNSYSGNIVNIEASRNSYAVYNLDGEYTRFSGKIVIAEDVYTDCVMDIAIYGDGRELYSKAGLTRQTEAQDFDLDVTVWEPWRYEAVERILFLWQKQSLPRLKNEQYRRHMLLLRS